MIAIKHIQKTFGTTDFLFHSLFLSFHCLNVLILNTKEEKHANKKPVKCELVLSYQGTDMCRLHDTTEVENETKIIHIYLQSGMSETELGRKVTSGSQGFTPCH